MEDCAKSAQQKSLEQLPRLMKHDYFVKSIRFDRFLIINDPTKRETNSPIPDVNQVKKNGACATTFNSSATVNIDAAKKNEK